MQMKRLLCMVMVCVLTMGAMASPAKASEVQNTTTSGEFKVNLANARATGSFNMSISAKTRSLANSSFPLVVGETITIKASYSPFNASVDFGVIAPDGKYYYFNITDGSIDKTIEVSQSGDYILQIRNNSDSEVKVSGFVNY